MNRSAPPLHHRGVHHPARPIARRPAALRVALVAAALALAPAAAAAPEPPPPDAPPADFEPGPLPAAAAIIPGALVHGAGHFVAGDTDTALTLLGAQGVGLGLVVLGGVPLAATGASRKLIGPAIAVSVTGVGLLITPMLPDLYGALTGGRDAPAPARVPLTARLGYAWVYDPQFAYRHFSTVGYLARLGDIALDGSAWIAVDDDNQRLRQRLDWRVLGDNRGAPDRPGYVDLAGAVTWHRFGTDGFSRLSGELAIEGLYDMGRMGPTLRGSFTFAELGWALEAYHYDVPGLAFGEDVAEQLLLRFGYGIWFADRRGALSLYYDHRKDDHTGGLGTRGLGGGIPGYLGLAGDYALDDTWAVDLDLRVGAAYIVGVGVQYRYGGP